MCHANAPRQKAGALTTIQSNANPVGIAAHQIIQFAVDATMDIAMGVEGVCWVDVVKSINRRFNINSTMYNLEEGEA